MNILFVTSYDDIYSPEKPLSSWAEAQYGLSYLSSVLKNCGHSTSLVVLSRLTPGLNLKRIDNYMNTFHPAVIAFTAVTTEYPFIERTATYIRKKYPCAYQIIGGPHASLTPQTVSNGPFNAVCIGEGEYPLLELASQLDSDTQPTGIKNLWLKRAGLIEKNPIRPFINNLDSLPVPDMDIWKDWVNASSESEYPLLLGRGCPYSCTYCSNHALRKLASGVYVRFRSPKNIINELKDLPDSYSNIYLEVETIGANKTWLVELSEGLEALNKKRQRPFTFRTNLRVTPSLDIPLVFSALKRANIKTVNIGLESGSEKVRREILKRDYSNGDIKNAVKAARSNNIAVHFYNLIGVPGETYEDFKETLALNRECQPERSYAHIFFPYPGTDLHNVCMEKGLLTDKMSMELERCQAVLNLPGFRKSKIREAFVWFDFNIYKGKRPAHTLLAKTLISWIRSSPGLHRAYRSLSFSSPVKKLKGLLKNSIFRRI